MIENENFNAEVARYIDQFCRIPEAQRIEENLTFNQLLGSAIFEGLDALTFSEIRALYEDDGPDNTPPEIIEALVGPQDETLADQYKYEPKIDGVLRLLRRDGYKFNADSLIEVGLETKQLDEWLREIDHTGEHIPFPLKEETANKEKYFTQRFMGEVAYQRDAENHHIEQLSERTECIIRYEVDDNMLHISLGDNVSKTECATFAKKLEKFGLRIERFPATSDNDLPHSNFNLYEAGDSVKALTGFLQKEGYITHVAAESFNAACKQATQDHGHKR